jgi:hypothetical protein
MKLTFIANWTVLAFAIVPLAGCSTYNFYAEPSLPPKIQVFCTPQKNDLLVQYDELPARADLPRRRAYFLLENDLKIKCGKKPRFVKRAELSSLTLIRIPERTDLPATLGAATNYYIICVGNSFSLNDPGEKFPASFDLPTYKSFGIPVKDVLAGPAIIAAHAVVFAAIGAYCSAAEMARTGHVPTFP